MLCKSLITTIHKFGGSSAGVPPVAFFNPHKRVNITKRNLLRWRAWISPAGQKRNSLWQEESYDHLVPSEQELYRINEYVVSNPEKAGFRAAHDSRIGMDGDLGGCTYRRDACATSLNEIVPGLAS